MITLALDTSHPVGSVALATNGVVLGEARFDFRGAPFLRLEPFGDGGNFSGSGKPGEQPADEQGDDGGDDFRQIGCEFGWHAGFLLRLGSSSVS